jgi:threonine/homoserine/homoserine lactone efflux protein
MDSSLFVRGLILGFSIAAPVGPIGVLCIRRTLAEGRLVGFVSGLGAASADALLGCIAAFGLTAISGIMVSQQTALRLVGGVFLLYLGARTFLDQPHVNAAAAEDHGLPGAYVSTLALTLSNPMTIISFTAVFAGLGVGAGAASYLAAALVVAGVFSGSALWWLLLSSGISLLRAQIDGPKLVWINRISGIIIIVFGVLSVLSTQGYR